MRFKCQNPHQMTVKNVVCLWVPKLVYMGRSPTDPLSCLQWLSSDTHMLGVWHDEWGDAITRVLVQKSDPRWSGSHLIKKWAWPLNSAWNCRSGEPYIMSFEGPKNFNLLPSHRHFFSFWCFSQHFINGPWAWTPSLSMDFMCLQPWTMCPTPGRVIGTVQGSSEDRKSVV